GHKLFSRCLAFVRPVTRRLNWRRDHSGCVTEAAEVPYIEGWYVDAHLRGQGYGRQLIEAAEQWAKEKGFNELASDAEVENIASIAAHKALGFDETDRVVCFLKKLEDFNT
ncbi:MAG: GNAT family N-acetyltransferase, partial [Chloroflexota bacterium]